MDYVRRRDNSSSPHPTENSAEPLIRTNPSLVSLNEGEVDADDWKVWPSPPPSTTNSQHTQKPPPRSLFRGFESPNFTRIAILTLTCTITYPAFYALTLVAKDRSLFIVRLIVAVWCSGIGLALQYTLLKIGARHLEAASEFTPVGYRGFLKLSLNSLGHGDSHELRRRRDETPRSGHRHKQSDGLCARPPDLLVSVSGSRDFQEFASGI